MLTDTKANQSESFGGVTSPEADVTLQGGETLKTSGEIPWTVLATPGHTPGSLSYQIDTHEKRLIFTGDFIYRDGTSNTELPLANSETFEESLHAFLENEPHDALVYPGFGPNTTVGEFYSNLSQHATNNEAVNDLAMDSGTAVAYQATYSEVYPTTTIIYDDLYEPYYPIIGFRVWPWRPIRPLPPPPPHRPHHPHHPPGPHPGPHPHPHPHPGPGPRPVIDPHDRPGHWNPANRPDPAVRPHHEPNHSGGNRPSPGIHHVPDHRLNPAFRLDRPSHSPNRVSPAPFRPGGRGAPGNVIHPGGSGFHGRGGHVPHGGGGFHGGGHGGRH